MRIRAVERRIGNSRLTAVPAVHFRIPFAHAINEICSTPATRPKAIAVELGEASCRAVHEWLFELKTEMARGVTTELPCMLGLTKPVRRIRTSKKEQAWALQERWKKSLHEIPPDILREELDFSSVSVLYLSSTDSIIEAIRCAIELDVPVYGVDLEETAYSTRKEASLEDPVQAHRDLDRYVRRNADYAAYARCNEIDDRRDRAMAARLKGLLEKHDHVLFTCGLAHWIRLDSLLTDAQVQPAPFPPEEKNATEQFIRCIIHPLHAVHHMDLFPVMASEYERKRNPAWRRSAGSLDYIDPDRTFQILLDETYFEYFADDGDQDDQLKRRFEDLENLQSFEQVLTNLCLLKQMEVPDLFTVLETAEAMMSPQFCRRLAEELMAFEWAQSADHSQLPTLEFVPTSTSQGLKAEYRDHRGRRSKSFFVESRPGNSPTVEVPVPWEWVPGKRGVSQRVREEMDRCGPDKPKPQKPMESEPEPNSERQELPEEELSEEYSPPEDHPPVANEEPHDSGSEEVEERDPGASEADEPEIEKPEPIQKDGPTPEVELNEDEKSERGTDPDGQEDDKKKDENNENIGGNPSEGGKKSDKHQDKEGSGDGLIEGDDGQEDQGEGDPDPPPEPWEIPEHFAAVNPPASGTPRTWPPEGVLQTLMAIRADQIAGVGRQTGGGPTLTERFEGSLMDGVDIKATMRARVRGEPDIYVRDCRLRQSINPQSGIGPSLTIFILRPGWSPNSKLFIHNGPLRDYFRHFVEYPHRLDEAENKLGRSCVDGLSVLERGQVSQAKQAAGVTMYKVRGLVAFTPGHFDHIEEARWLEETDYIRGPILNDPREEGLIRMYKERYGIELDISDWPTFLVRATIPYATTTVNIIAEDAVKIDPIIYHEGQRRGVTITRLPLSMFPPDYIRAISQQHHATPLDNKSGSYPELTERAMGETADRYRELLPKPLREYRSKRFGGR